MNDLIMLVAFAPIVTFLVSGAAGSTVPFRVLLYSVVIFVVIPLVGGVLSARRLLAEGGRVVRGALPAGSSRCVIALLATLVLIFAFQAENITTRWFHVDADRDPDPDPGVLQLRR